MTKFDVLLEALVCGCPWSTPKELLVAVSRDPISMLEETKTGINDTGIVLDHDCQEQGQIGIPGLSPFIQMHL